MIDSSSPLIPLLFFLVGVCGFCGIWYGIYQGQSGIWEENYEGEDARRILCRDSMWSKTFDWSLYLTKKGMWMGKLKKEFYAFNRLEKVTIRSYIGFFFHWFRHVHHLNATKARCLFERLADKEWRSSH